MNQREITKQTAQRRNRSSRLTPNLVFAPLPRSGGSDERLKAVADELIVPMLVTEFLRWHHLLEP